MKTLLPTLIFLFCTSLRGQTPYTSFTVKQSNQNQAVYDNIFLGDDHKTVTAKIRSSQLLELSVDEVYLARVGLNGSYRTKKTLSNLKYSLYFDWDESSKLKELTLQSQPQPSSAYQGLLKENWTQFISLMTQLYGKPLQAGNYPDSSALQNDTSLSTHLWRLSTGGSALIGASKSTEGIMIVARFTTDVIEPIIIKK